MSQYSFELSDPEKNRLKPVLDSMKGHPKQQSFEGFEHLIPLLPKNNGNNPGIEIELIPEKA